MLHRPLIAAFALALPLAAAANAPQNITPGEMARLPAYCPHTQTFSPRGMPEAPTPEQAPWVAIMGRTFWGMHHYCWALISAHRATQPGLSRQQRDHLYGSAVSDIYFVLNMAPPDFPLLPELYYRAGEYLRAAGRLPEALEHYERSRAIKADYWPPYLGISEIYVQIGRRKEAGELLRAGLQQMPDQPQLLQALRALGGNGAPR